MNETCFFSVMIICGLSKFFSIVYLATRKVVLKENNTFSFFLLLFALLGVTLGDLTWAMKYLQVLYIPTLSYSLTVFVIRIAFAFLAIQYQALALLLNSLDVRKPAFSNPQKIISAISLIFVLYFLSMALFSNQLNHQATRLAALALPHGFWQAPLEIKMMRFLALFLLPTLSLACLNAIRKARRKKFPKLLKQQVELIVHYFYVPFIIAEVLYLLTVTLQMPITMRLPLVAASSSIVTLMIIVFLRNIFKIRFLNSAAFVSRRKALNFVNKHAEIIGEVKRADTIKELRTLAKQFFSKILAVKTSQVQLHVRSTEAEDLAIYEQGIYRLLQHRKNEKLAFLENTGAINEHDLAFDLFYHDSQTKQELLAFMKNLSISVMTPLFCRDELIGFVAVHNPVPDELLIDATQRDEMILFSQTLQAALMHIEHTDLRAVHAQCKRSNDVLKLAHNKFERVRRTLKKHLEQESSNHVGMVFYRSGALVPGNQIARDLLPVTTRFKDDIPLVQECKQVAESIEKYKTPKRITICHEGKEFCVSGSPSIEHSGTMVFITNTELLEAVRAHPGLMIGKDDWEYLLCIGTSKTSRVLDQFLPGVSKQLVALKVSLLRAALQCAPIWLSVHKHDSLAIAELVHQLSEREQFEQYQITTDQSTDTFIQDLFGMSPLIDTAQEHPGLLQKMHNTGTILLEHIDLLPRDAQEQLASFLATNVYRPQHSHKQYTADVRIIVTTRGHSLTDMVTSGHLSQELVTQLYALSPTRISELIENDLIAIANGFFAQLAPDLLSNYVCLTKQETRELIAQRPTSLTGLRRQIRVILSKREMTTFAKSPVKYTGTIKGYDPLMESAAQLGKKALQDQAMMTALWKKCKSQQRIAQLLGVNRSSVSRRCKEYGLA